MKIKKDLLCHPSTAIMACAFLIWGGYLRIQVLARREWWCDEICQWEHTVGALKPVWQRLPNGELTCFPGDYLLTYPFVSVFGHNKWEVAIPHMIASVLGFYCLYLICRRYLKSPWATAIAFLIYSLNAELIYHALELRPYGVLSTLGLAIFYCTETIVCAQYSITRFKKLMIGVLFGLTMIYHAYGIVIIVFCALFSILNERALTPLSDILRRITGFYALVGLGSFPIWYWYASYNIGGDVANAAPTFNFIPNPAVNMAGFFKSIFGNLMGNKLLYPLLAGPILAFILSESRRKLMGFFLVLIVLPIMLLCLVDMNKNYWFIQRQFIWEISLFSFFVAWCWDAVIKKMLPSHVK